jgi:hypothetical protein
MRSNRPQISKGLVVLLAGTLGTLGACSEIVNPWADETVGSEWITTASVEGTRAAQAEPPVRAMEYKPVLVSPQDGTVAHFPLWWEDPFEDRGSDDGRFSWTWEDYFAMPYGHARMALNTLAVPISAIVQPPAPLMGSDGITSRQALGFDHDAEWLPTGSSPTPPDILEIGADPLGAAPAGD